MSKDYDHNIHSNPDAMAWAMFYKEINPDSDVSTMVGWFANAMMAMYDSMYHVNKFYPQSPETGDLILRLHIQALAFRNELSR